MKNFVERVVHGLAVEKGRAESATAILLRRVQEEVSAADYARLLAKMPELDRTLDPERNQTHHASKTAIAGPLADVLAELGFNDLQARYFVSMFRIYARERAGERIADCVLSRLAEFN